LNKDGNKVFIDSNTRFTKNGYYEVFIVYTFNNYKFLNDKKEVVDANNYVKVQTFAFTIENIDPQITLKTVDKDSNKTDFSANGYTNQNVVLTWETGNQFNVLPEVKIFSQQFDSTNAVNVTSSYATGISNGEVTFESSCKYIITISYGPCTWNSQTNSYDYSASVTYNFTIDKNAISGIEFWEMESGTINTQSAFLIGDKTSDKITTSSFAVVFGEKQENSVLRTGKKLSGAKITATYSFIPFEETNDYSTVNDVYLTNGYIAKNISENLNYKQISTVSADNENIFTTDLNSVLTENGIYVFNFVDDAGNTASKIIVIDKTTPAVVQKNGNDLQHIVGTDNIVDYDAELFWGTHKAIEIVLDNEELINTLTNFLGDYQYHTSSGDSVDTLYYINPISSVTITVDNQTKYSTSTDSGVTIYAQNENSALTGEGVYFVNVADSLKNQNPKTIVEMNFDKALLQAYVIGNASNNVQNIGGTTESKQSTGTGETRVFSNCSTNRQKLYIKWLANEDTDYEIASVTCEFYPLTFDAGSDNYPYSSTASQTFDLTKNTTTENNGGNLRVISTYINTVQDDRYGETATMAGMYKITRTYKGDIPDNSLDKQEREYYFYVDRQNIISYFNNNIEIGSGITIDMQNGSKTFSGTQFLQEFITSYVLTTNKLPVKVSAPKEKYTNSKANPILLNYFIKDGYGIVVYDSTSAKYDSITPLTSNGTYTVTIYDNTNGDGYTAYEAGVNELTFSFVIDNSAPKISIINSNNVETNVDSFNTTKIKLVWSEDSEGYKANIDKDNITIKKIYESGKEQVVYQIADGKVSATSLIKSLNIVDKRADSSVSWDWEIDFSQIANENENCKYEITVQYEGNEADYGSQFKTTSTIYFDYSAPEYNINKLIAGDELLTAEEKNGFMDTSSAVNFENYAFVVDETYKLEYAPISTFWKNDQNGNSNDTVSAWFRKYDKYSSDVNGLAMQSIVPSDSRYSDPTQAPQRLRFNQNLKDSSGKKYYTEITDRSSTLYDLVNGEEGYYEIIEMDITGNYTIYTVALYSTNSLKNLAVNYNSVLETVDGDITTSNFVSWEEIGTNTFHYNINSKDISLTDITLPLESFVGNNWFNVVAISNKNGVQSQVSYKVSTTDVEGYLTVEELIDSLNEFLAHDVNSKDGFSYSITIRNAYGLVYTIDYKTPGQNVELNFVEASQYLTVMFTQDPTSSTYITEFYVYEAKNGVVEYTDTYRLTEDSYGKEIPQSPDTPVGGTSSTTYSYTFRNNSGEGRNLTFVYVDNFGVQTKINKIIGITDVKYENMMSFGGDYDTYVVNDDEYFGGVYYEYYTNSTAKLTYQPKIYNLVSITLVDSENAITELDLDLLTSAVQSNGTKTVLIYSELPSNSHNVYTIELEDTTGNKYHIVVHYYTKLATLHFYDSSEFEYDLSTSKIVTRSISLRYDKDEFAPYETTVSVNKVYTDLYGNVHEENYVVSSESDYIFTDYATYTITASNRFGEIKQYSFEIRQSTTTYYSVSVKPDGINAQIIDPSETKYAYQNKNIDWYFTVYDAEIEVNSARDILPAEAVFEDGNTTVYYIHTNDTATITYEKWIAITKVNSSTSFISNALKINDDVITGRTAKYKTKTVSINMPAYNQVTGNKIKVQIYFNGEYVGYVNNYELSQNGETMTFELNNCGVYYLYVSDIAGNNQMFSNSRYFTLYVLNDVIYKLNGSYGVYNSIYNSSVTLSLEQASQFDQQNINGRVQFISVNATLNGKSYSPTQSSGTYIFSSYGTYVVTLTGIVNGDTANPVVTTAKFSIINPNEAKIAHEYIGLNGYEITAIVKDNVDITDEIREKLNMLSLNSFAISGGLNSIGGNGHYTITVSAYYDEIVPSRQFSYSVWINNKTDALILCSLKEGESTTKTISLQLNLYQIYSNIGECVVKINGNNYIVINEQTASQNSISTYSLTTNQRYNVTLETNSGNTLSSFVVTKVEPLNTIAIIVIVIVSIAVAGLTITFILLRKKMRIR
jgi:hypothetical protein